MDIKGDNIAEFKILTSIEPELWNEFVRNHPKTSIHQTKYIADVHDKTKNCKAVTLAVQDKNEDIVGVLIAINFSVSSGMLKTISTHTTIRGGPIVDDSPEGLKVCKFLMKEYDRIKKGTLYTRVYPLKYNKSAKQALESEKFEHEGFLDFHINLNRAEDEIWSDIHKGRRKNINRSQKRFNLKAVELKKREEIPTFYELLKETHQNAGVSLEDISLFYAAYDILVPNKFVRFIFAVKDNEPVGCRAVLTYNNEIYDWYAGAKREALNCYPNDFLVWHVLSWGRENGFQLFDFGGAGPANVEFPVRTFKERFGGQLINYGRYTKVHSPLKFKLATKGFETIQSLKKKKKKKKSD
ncbi:MAG: lipid II:glycine glycyltransferase FemX [Candidatus Thorarchaeota archaeon]